MLILINVSLTNCNCSAIIDIEYQQLATYYHSRILKNDTICQNSHVFILVTR